MAAPPPNDESLKLPFRPRARLLQLLGDQLTGTPRLAVKLTFLCPASLKADLDRYATLHAHTYGEPVDTVTLIPHMLEAFMARDRGFKKGTAAKAPSVPPRRDVPPT